jgi:uncharacterized protein involved in propanediol utilization
MNEVYQTIAKHEEKKLKKEKKKRSPIDRHNDDVRETIDSFKQIEETTACKSKATNTIAGIASRSGHIRCLEMSRDLFDRLLSTNHCCCYVC